MLNPAIANRMACRSNQALRIVNNRVMDTIELILNVIVMIACASHLWQEFRTWIRSGAWDLFKK